MRRLAWYGRSTPRAASTVPPEQAALARMSPEARARMAEMMKGRGVSMPDARGATRVCVTKEQFESGGWQQMAADSGCTTTFSARSGSTWKWHSTCTKLQSESDGEAVFSGPESYRTKMTTTATVRGKKSTVTRMAQAKWLGAGCGDVKPFMPTDSGRRRP